MKTHTWLKVPDAVKFGALTVGNPASPEVETTWYPLAAISFTHSSAFPGVVKDFTL